MEEILVFGHRNPDTDSICSSLVKASLNNKNGKEKSKAVRLGNINKETEYVLNYLGIEAPELIEKVEKDQKVIMVDHNEFNQSVEGIENAKILGVIDHHRIANFETSEPLYYTARPYGCTSTILYKDYISKGIEIDKTEAVLMASAIVSDTLLLKSPTTTDHDRKALTELAKIADLDIEKYGLEMLKAGTDLDSFTEKELLKIDAKLLEKDEIKYIIAQVNTVSIEDVLKRQEKIEEEIKNAIMENALNLFVFVITDIVESNSKAIVMGNRTDLISKTYNIENNIADMPGVVSRKKQILPLIEKNM